MTLRIVLVENHADTLSALQLYLEDLGHQVTTAMTVEGALRVLPSSPCDLLICDIGLPDGTGWDVLQKAGLQRPIFAVAMSGFGMNANSVRSQDAGFRRHLLKPFKADELDSVLSEATAELLERADGIDAGHKRVEVRIEVNGSGRLNSSHPQPHER